MVTGDEKPEPVFHLADLERVSPQMKDWLLEKRRPDLRL